MVELEMSGAQYIGIETLWKVTGLGADKFDLFDQQSRTAGRKRFEEMWVVAHWKGAFTILKTDSYRLHTRRVEKPENRQTFLHLMRHQTEVSRLRGGFEQACIVGNPAWCFPVPTPAKWRRTRDDATQRGEWDMNSDSGGLQGMGELGERRRREANHNQSTLYPRIIEHGVCVAK